MTTTATKNSKAAYNGGGLDVSLEPHLLDTLRPLLRLLPEELKSQLEVTIPPERPPSSIISYSVLSLVSAWARSQAGAEALTCHDPPLRPSDYSMIALLAGTRTSPERKFPAYAARSEDAEVQKAYSDRRAVTNVLNALLSIGGAGVATWWAAGRLAWKDEWKVLLSLAVALVVAASEAILYLIWDSRQPQRPNSRRRPPHRKPSESKKDTEKVSASSTGPNDALRQDLSISSALADPREVVNLRERTGAGKWQQI